jgi:hypothetical protein
MTKYLVRGLVVSAELGMSSKVALHLMWLDTSQEGMPLKGDYQKSASAIRVPHFLSSCNIYIP